MVEWTLLVNNMHPKFPITFTHYWPVYKIHQTSVAAVHHKHKVQRYPESKPSKPIEELAKKYHIKRLHDLPGVWDILSLPIK